MPEPQAPTSPPAAAAKSSATTRTGGRRRQRRAGRDTTRACSRPWSSCSDGKHARCSRWTCSTPCCGARCPSPTNAFVLLGARLEAEGALAGDITAGAFADLRVGGRAARAQPREGSGRGVEVTLAEICELVPAGRAADQRRQTGRARAGARAKPAGADLDVAELARHARERGMRRGLRLGHLLLRGPAALAAGGGAAGRPGDRPRVRRPRPTGSARAAGCGGSCSSGSAVDGRTGRARGRQPRGGRGRAGRAGVQGVYFERRPAGLARDGLARGPARAERPLSPYHGDYGLTALRAKVLHRTEGTGQPAELAPFWRFGAAGARTADGGLRRVGPRARRRGRGQQGLLHDARGQRLLRARQLAARPARPPRSPRSRSGCRGRCARGRRSWTARAEELDALFQRRRMPTVGEFCRTLGIAARRGGRLRRARPARGWASPTWPARLVDSHRRRRRAARAHRGLERDAAGRLMRYIERLRPPGEDRLVLVDLGWGATIQTLLDRLLAEVRLGPDDHRPLPDDHRPRRRRGCSTAPTRTGSWPARRPPRAAPSTAFMRSPELIEQICMPDHGSQIDMDEQLEPVLEDAEPLPIQAAAARGGRRRGSRASSASGCATAPPCPTTSCRCTSTARTGCGRSSSARSRPPPPDEAALFAGWLHDENFGSLAPGAAGRADLDSGRCATCYPRS